jgi:membrane associated rhomboid family serine protease
LGEEIRLIIIAHFFDRDIINYRFPDCGGGFGQKEGRTPMRIVHKLILTVLVFMMVPVTLLIGAMIGVMLSSDYGPNGAAMAAIGGGLIGAIVGIILAIILTIPIWFRKQKKESQPRQDNLLR